MKTTRLSLLSITIITQVSLLFARAEEPHGESGSSVIPADKKASASVRAILQYINDLTKRDEKKLMTGQFLGWHPHVTMKAAEAIHEQSGEWVAIIGVDYYETKLTDAKLTEPEFFKPPRWKQINPLIKEYWSKGGLATLSVTMTNPYTGGKAWDQRKRASSDLLDSKTEAGKAYSDQLRQIADGIEDLQKDNVAILYRPFHEWDWAFWWGRLEPELARDLWKQMFDYFTKERGLHNIIWIYNGSMNRYPGNDYADINSYDYYTDSPIKAATKYKEMQGTGRPFAIGEFGPPGNAFDPDSPRNYDYAPFAKNTIKAGSGIVYFLAWRDAWGLHRNPGTKELLKDPLVLNRDDLARELFNKLETAEP